MRRRTVLLSMAATLLGACGYGEAPAGAAGTRTLIVYYSWSGNTRAAAERIRELTGGTAEEIRPVKPYPEDYAACVELAKGECRTEATPAIAALEADPADFTGQSYLAPLTRDGRLGVPVANVTFEPGCRNNWHSHTGGQLLVAVGGVGYYQERGKPARRLVPGDVVEIPPEAEHWHGAAPDSWFAHLAIECNPQTNKNTWLEPVSDAEYAAATK